MKTAFLFIFALVSVSTYCQNPVFETKLIQKGPTLSNGRSLYEAVLCSDGVPVTATLENLQQSQQTILTSSGVVDCIVVNTADGNYSIYLKKPSDVSAGTGYWEFVSAVQTVPSAFEVSWSKVVVYTGSDNVAFTKNPIPKRIDENNDAYLAVWEKL